ncbi:MAG: hypothetical protein [Bacteriophage sp.]|nr:MAG: hypothetical protein [Bacteriophage sp.]
MQLILLIAFIWLSIKFRKMILHWIIPNKEDSALSVKVRKTDFNTYNKYVNITDRIHYRVVANLDPISTFTIQQALSYWFKAIAKEHTYIDVKMLGQITSAMDIPGLDPTSTYCVSRFAELISKEFSKEEINIKSTDLERAIQYSITTE